MDLSKISIAARQRSAWEAIDLGILLAKQWYWPLLLGWMIPSFIVFIAVTLIFHESLWIALIIIWWFKPIWDRVPLLIASRALFGEKLSVKQALSQLLSSAKTDWFAWLTWRRFSLTRAFDMPVTVLEGIKGEARQKRLTVLHIKSKNAATWLTIICIHLEFVIVFGLLGLIYLFIPEETNIDLVNIIIDDEWWTELIGNIITYFSMLIIAPFYTIAGFSLYISRRIELEAWDIEIRFRHLAERLANAKPNLTQQTRTSTLQQFILISLFPLFLFGAPANEAAAQEKTIEPVAISSAAKAAREDVSEILQGPDFAKEKITRSWRFKNAEDMAEEEAIPEWLIRIIEFFEFHFTSTNDSNNNNYGLLFAQGVEFLLWLIAIILLVYLLFYIRAYLLRQLKNKSPGKKPSLATPEIMFGLDVREESLPENIPQNVLNLWQTGANRDALGLLYRATLSRLVHQYKFNFSDSATENECTEIVALTDQSELSHYLQNLTRTWQRLAYGHRMPSEKEVIFLCDNWEGIFSREN